MKLFLGLLFALLPAILLAQDLPITGYPSDTNPTCDDLILTINDPSGTPVDRKVRLCDYHFNILSSSAPTANDDSGDGYVAGKTMWLNTSTGLHYLLTNASLGAAVWTAVGSGGGGAGDIEDVTAGAGLTGGGSTGPVTLDAAVTSPIALVGDTIGCPTCLVAETGDISDVVAGTGLTGGNTSGSAILDVAVTSPIALVGDTVGCPTCVTDISQVTIITTSPGPPSGSACLHGRHFIVDTSSPGRNLYYCPDGTAGSTPRTTHSNSAAINAVQGNSGSSPAAPGGSTLSLIGAGGINCVASGTAPIVVTCTGSGAPTTKPFYIPAGGVEVDGVAATGCAISREQQNSGPFKGVMKCADNASGRFDITINTLGFGWTGAAVTLSVHSYHSTSETVTWASDVSMQCRSAGDVIDNTYSTPVNFNIDITSADVNELKTTTLAAHTPNGTCAANDELNIKGIIDATSMGANAANTQIIGFTVVFPL